MDSWINRQIDKQTGVVKSLHWKDLHWPFQRVTRGRNDKSITFELEVDHYLPMIECIVNVCIEGQMDRYPDG